MAWLLLCSAISARCMLPGMTADRESDTLPAPNGGAGVAGRDATQSGESSTGGTGAQQGTLERTPTAPDTSQAAGSAGDRAGAPAANAGAHAGLGGAGGAGRSIGPGVGSTPGGVSAGAGGEGGASGASASGANSASGAGGVDGDGQAGGAGGTTSPPWPVNLAVFPELSLPFEIHAAATGACLVTHGSEPGIALAKDPSACSAPAGRFWLVRASENAYRLLSAETGLTLAGTGLGVVQGAASADTLWAVERPPGGAETRDGPFELRAVGTQHCLDAATDTGLGMAACADGVSQQWSFHFALETPLSLLVKHSEMCLDVPPGGDALQQYYCHGHSNQRWSFLQIAPALDSSGPAYLISSAASGRCLGVEDDSLDVHAQIREADCTGAPSQRWHVANFSDGFELSNQNSGQCMDVWNAELSIQTQLQQFPCHEGSNQRFRVVNAAQRRLHVYQLARSDGSDRASIDADLLGAQIDLINAAYSPTGIWLEYHPEELGAIDSDALYALSDASAQPSDCRDGMRLTPTACANLVAADTPDEVVVFVSPGSRAVQPGDTFLSIPSAQPGVSTSCAALAGARAARELGSFLGLSDPSVRRATLAEIEATYLAAHGQLGVFDGDGFDDTAPLPYWDDPWLVCDSAAPATPFFALTLSDQPLTIYAGNVMSPYVTGQRTLSLSQVDVVRAVGFARHW